MTKTYDLSGREKGPPKISKLDTINKQINKVIVKDNIIELFIATFTYFKRKSFLYFELWGCNSHSKNPIYQKAWVSETIKNFQVSSAFAALDKDKDGLVTKKDFERSFPSLSQTQVVPVLQGKKSTFLKVDACFKKFDKDKDGMLNFVEFKNFMGKRKSLPDKVNLQETLDSIHWIWLLTLNLQCWLLTLD